MNLCVSMRRTERLPLQENITISIRKRQKVYQVRHVKQILMRGTGFVGGKGRVCEIYRTEIDAGTRAKRIKAEYGQGGASWPLTVWACTGMTPFHGSGLRIQWKDQDGEVEGYVSWKNVEKEIGVLILPERIPVGDTSY